MTSALLCVTAPVLLCLHPERRAVTVVPGDFSWQTATELRRQLAPLLETEDLVVSVDLGHMVVSEASVFWLAFLVSLARQVRVRRSRLVVLNPPMQLAGPLRRARIDVRVGLARAGSEGMYQAAGRRAQ